MLGWRILPRGEYSIDLPVLSKDEEELISAAEEKFREVARFYENKNEEENQKLICDIVGKTAEEQRLYLDRSQQGYLGRVAFIHIYGFAFMEQLITDPQIEEISVIGPNKPVYVYIRQAGWKQVNACFDSEKAIGEMVNRMARSLGRHITMQNPRLDAMLPDRSRLHASLHPVSLGEITIRKFREKPFSPSDLVDNSTITIDALAFLSIVMQCDFSLLIAGNTASGKTTTMNALFSFVPANERIIITEETPEINLPHRHQLRLVANREMGITLKDLVYDTLRMRPDRMIVGEVRNKEETEALFDVLLAGQARGNYATFHAQSANETLSRLQSFGISKTDLSAIDCIMVQRRMLVYDSRKRTNTEVRKVVEIATVNENADIIYRDGTLTEKNSITEKAAESFGLSMKEMETEFLTRKKLLKNIQTIGDDFAQIQNALFGLVIDAASGNDNREDWR